MRFRPANIRLINRRSNLPRLLLALSSKNGKNNGNNKNNPTDSQVDRSLHIRESARAMRFVGFTGHKDPDVHLAMLNTGFPLDSVQMPLNAFDATYLMSFEQKVLPGLNQRGIAPLGMKPTRGHGRPCASRSPYCQ